MSDDSLSSKITSFVNIFMSGAKR